jgi:hypothetical protein
MTDERKAQLALEQMKMAFDYTKWHIGLYAGSIALLLSGKRDAEAFLPIQALFTAVLLLLTSALCGAVVASSLLDAYKSYGLWADEALGDFWNVKVGPYRWQWMKLKWWGFIEHLTFWAAVLLILVMFAVKNLPQR